MTRSPTILVTNVSGSLGQGVLRLLQSTAPSCRRVGISTDRVSAANHLCDVVHHVPWRYDRLGDADAATVVEICERESVQLIIPCTDVETVVLSKNAARLPPLACSGFETSRLFYDKYLTAGAFEAAGIPFAESMLPSAYDGRFPGCVVKPREGGLSVGVVFDPQAPTSFSDDYVIQRRYEGTEITTALYVTRTGKLLGHITLERELRHGITFKCSVTHRFDQAISEIASRMARSFDIRGACHIQSIATRVGRVVPFEVNCRVSGTASIRAQFGFEDIRYLVEEHLFCREPAAPALRSGCAVRFVADVIYPNVKLDEVRDGDRSEHYLF